MARPRKCRHARRIGKISDEAWKYKFARVSERANYLATLRAPVFAQIF